MEDRRGGYVIIKERGEREREIQVKDKRFFFFNTKQGDGLGVGQSILAVYIVQITGTESQMRIRSSLGHESQETAEKLPGN